MGKNSLNSRRLYSLVRRRDFLALREHGHTVRANRWLLGNFQRNSSGQVRVGWTLPRYVGPAVVRNRLRRWGREFFRAWLKTAEIDVDLNIVLRRQDSEFYKDLTHEEFDEALGRLVRDLARHPEFRGANGRALEH